MDEQTQKDIRGLLKTFGIGADEMIQQYLAKYPQVQTLDLRITLKDMTDYGDEGPNEMLFLEIEGQVRR
jgi:hypothetical protein